MRTKHFFLTLATFMFASLWLQAENVEKEYIEKPKSNWTFKLTTRYDWMQMNMRGDAFQASLRSQPRIKQGFSVSFKGFTLGGSFTLGEKPKNSWAISMHSYGSKFCSSLDFIRDRTFTGTMTFDDVPWEFSKGDVTHTSLNYDAWYIFSGKKFSFPAVFNQNRIQKHSAGSFLLSASYKGNWNRFQVGPLDRLTGHTLGFGGGYGFNLVAGPFLFHASLIGNMLVMDTTRYILRENNEKVKVKYGFPSFTATANVGILFNFKRFFTGIMVSGYDCTVGNKAQVRMDFLRFYSSFVIGIRL